MTLVYLLSFGVVYATFRLLYLSSRNRISDKALIIWGLVLAPLSMFANSMFRLNTGKELNYALIIIGIILEIIMIIIFFKKVYKKTGK